MSDFLLLVCCVVAGILFRKTGRTPDGAHSTLNAVIIHLSLPAVTLHTLHTFKFDLSKLWPVLMPWVLFGVGAIAFGAIGRWLGPDTCQRWSPYARREPWQHLVRGLPMSESLQGADGLGLGLLIDQLGSYFALSPVGVFVAVVYATEERSSLRAMAVKVASLPPFIALVVALLIRTVGPARRGGCGASALG